VTNGCSLVTNGYSLLTNRYSGARALGVRPPAAHFVERFGRSKNATSRIRREIMRLQWLPRVLLSV
jgi:hypothetical protein